MADGRRLPKVYGAGDRAKSGKRSYRKPAARVKQQGFSHRDKLPGYKAHQADVFSAIEIALDLYGLEPYEVGGEGDCQFRALAFHIFNDAERHAEVRDTVVQELREHPDRYIDFAEEWSVPEQEGHSYWTWVASMARPGSWGGNTTLRAAATAYERPINVVSAPVRSNAYHVKINPFMPPVYHDIWIAYLNENHYQATRSHGAINPDKIPARHVFNPPPSVSSARRSTAKGAAAAESQEVPDLTVAAKPSFHPPSSTFITVKPTTLELGVSSRGVFILKVDRASASKGVKVGYRIDAVGEVAGRHANVKTKMTSIQEQKAELQKVMGTIRKFKSKPFTLYLSEDDAGYQAARRKPDFQRIYARILRKYKVRTLEELYELFLEYFKNQDKALKESAANYDDLKKKYEEIRDEYLNALEIRQAMDKDRIRKPKGGAATSLTPSRRAPPPREDTWL